MGQITRTNFGLTKAVTLTNAQIIGLPDTGGPVGIVVTVTVFYNVVPV